MNFPKYELTRKRLLIVGISLFAVALILSAAVIRKSYTDNLRPLTSDAQGVSFTVNPGDTASEVADGLSSKGIIRSDWAFEWYIRNRPAAEIKAGTYLLKSSQSIPEIAQILIDGVVATDLVTILPAQRLDQIRKALVDAGFSQKAVDKALEPTQYHNHPALTDKPRSASLEGYLYPESFLKTAETTPKQIIKLSLDEMSNHLTPDIRQAFSENGLTTHQAIILASIVEQEVDSSDNKERASLRAKVAQVFLKRYKEGIKLQSDPTAYYMPRMKGEPDSVRYDSPYNTYLHPGLPPSPIGNVSKSSLEAVAFPAQTDWLYFVSGDDGKTYFSKTLEKHQELTRRYCTKLCAN